MQKIFYGLWLHIQCYDIYYRYILYVIRTVRTVYTADIIYITRVPVPGEEIINK